MLLNYRDTHKIFCKEFDLCNRNHNKLRPYSILSV